MGAFLNCVSFIFEVKISFVNVSYIRSRIRQLMNIIDMLTEFVLTIITYSVYKSDNELS